MLQRYVSKELTHFVGASLRDKKDAEEEQYKLLVTILREGLLRGGGMSPNHANTNIIVVSINPKGNFSGETIVKAPSVCFCDIPVNDLGIHMGKFSRFGLSFLKEFLLSKRVNPVFYVAVNSNTIAGRSIVPRKDCFDDTIRAYYELQCYIRDNKEELKSSGFESLIKDFDTFDTFFNFQILAFLKPFEHKEPDSDQQNYYMEREWRVLGRVSFDLTDVHRIILPKAYVNRLRCNMPDYNGQITFADEYMPDGK